MSFQGLLFLLAIFWILESKNTCLVFLMILLKDFQSFKLLEVLYSSSSLWQSSFHYDFKYLVILMTFECLNQISSVLCMNSCTTCSRLSLLEIWSILRLLTELISLTRKFFSFLLFLTLVWVLVWIYSSKIAILTMSGVWSNISLHSGWIVWLSNSDEVGQRNARSMTEFESF